MTRHRRARDRLLQAATSLLLTVSCAGPEPDPGQRVDSERTGAAIPVAPGASTPPAEQTPPGASTPPAEQTPPGQAVVRVDAAGTGACARRTLADVIAEVHRRWPELGDIRELRGANRDRIGDGSFVYAFAQPPGFALAFKRGGGDCPAGCTENEYWYFATDDRCEIQSLGHYRAAWSAQNCLQVIGAPLWGTPQVSDPALVCQGF